MKNWEAAEREIGKLCGGKRTPGSGNKGLKGDVRIKGTGWYIESKQTDAEVLDVELEWLREMLLEKAKCDLILCVYFYRRGYAYWHVGRPSEPGPAWKTKRIKEEDLPAEIITTDSRWVLEPIESLKELRRA